MEAIKYWKSTFKLRLVFFVVDDVVVHDPDEGVAAGLETALSLSDTVLTWQTQGY